MAKKKCPDCNNTGYMGGGKSGIYCPCMKGTEQELKDNHVPSVEEVKAFLEKKGYQGGQKDTIKDALLFYKKVREKHQLCVLMYEISLHGKLYVSFCVEMVFNTVGNHWAKIEFYSIPWKDLQTDLRELEQRLVLSIAPMGGHPRHYDPE